MKHTISGLLPVLQTPFHDDETIDWAVLAREMDWLLEQRVDGVVIAMVSEVLRLTESERLELAERVCGHMRNRGAAIVSVGAESSKASEALARHAERVGATGVMAIPPIATACSEAELTRYYERILDAVAIPVIVQDASGYVGRPLSIRMQADLFHRHGPRVMFKPEAPPLGQRLSALRDATGGAAAIFEGSGGIAMVDAHRRGIAGTMPGCDLIRVIGPLWRALEDRNENAVWRIWSAVAPLLSTPTSLDSFLAIEKHLLRRQGVFNSTLVRGPVGYTLDAETQREVDALFGLAVEAVRACVPAPAR